MGQPGSGGPFPSGAAGSGLSAEPSAPGGSEGTKVEFLTVTAKNDAAKEALFGCLDAMDNFRPDLVLKRCQEALEKDDQLPLAHALLAQVSASAKKNKHLAAAKTIVREVPGGERLFTDGMIALAEDQRAVAKAAFYAFVEQLPGEKRAHYYRGLLRFRFSDLEGAEADFRKAIELDGKFGAAHNALGYVLLRREKSDEAAKSFAKYVEVSPKEGNAHDSLAALHLRKGDFGLAVEAARKAVELDGKFFRAHLRLGDALLLQGNPIMARKAYAPVLASPNPNEHFEAALHVAASRLFEGLGLPTAKALADAEKDLWAEVETAKKLVRRADQAQALALIARLQLERGAVVEAGKTAAALREVVEKNETPTTDAGDTAAPTLSADEKNRFAVEVLWLRALLFQAVSEREQALVQAQAIEKELRGKAGERIAEDLRGELAARMGNRQLTVNHLSSSTRPQSRLALALALGGGKPGEQIDLAKTRSIMEELGRRHIVDVEGGLTRGRARQWLKQNPAPTAENKTPS